MPEATPDKIFLQGLEVECIIGIFDWERNTPQKVLLDLEFSADIRKAAQRDQIEATIDYKTIAKRMIDFVSKSRYHLIETLAESIATLLLKEFKLPYLKLRISKPYAITSSQNVGVEIVRQK